MSHRMHRAFESAVGALLAAGIVLLSSCPLPITTDILQKQKDAVKPTVAITFPVDGSSYPATVVVTGTAADTSDAAGTAGKVTALRYDLTPATIAGADITTALRADGTYSFQFPTTGYTGTMLLTVTATDWNGNKGTASITLTNNGAIPSFTAAAGNHQVTINWDPVPLAQSYTVYYTSNGTPPSPSNGTALNGATSGAVIASLQNGALYSFLLQAHSSSGPDNWSNIVKAIPLSSLTLAPQVSTTLSGQVTVTWKAMAANTPVEVWRSLGSSQSDFFDLSGAVTGTSFIDYSVTPGQTYWYEVVPASYSTVASATVPGVTPLPSSLTRRISSTWSGANVANVAVFLMAGKYYAAIVDGIDDVVRVFNVTDDPGMTGVPKTVNGLAGTGYAQAIAFDGSITLVVAGLDGSTLRLGTVDVSNPNNPYLTNSNTVGLAGVSQINCVKANGTYACISEGYSGVQVASYLGSITATNRYNKNQDAQGMALYNNSILFVANYNNGIWVFDVSGGNITARTFGSQNNIPDTSVIYPQDVWVEPNNGNLILVADAYSGFIAISTNGGIFSSFTTVGTLDVPGTPTALAVDYSHYLAYVASYDKGLQIVNFANTGQLSLYDSYQLPSGRYATHVARSDKYAFTVDGSVEVINPNVLIDYGSPVDPPFYSVSLATTAAGGATDVKVQGNTAYVAAAGLEIYDVSTPGFPVPLGSVSSVSGGYMQVVGSMVYMASGSSGLQIFNASNPSSPALAGRYSAGDPRDVALYGDYAMIADGANGLRVVDVSTPSSPVLTALYPTPSSCRGVKLVGTLLYLFESSDMQILDVTDPAHPSEKGIWRALTATVSGGDVVGNYAFVADNGLVVLDVSNPLNPVAKAAAIPLNGSYNPVRVKVVGSFAYASVGTGGDGGLQVYDVTNPLEPVFKGYCYDSSSTASGGLDFAGSTLLLACDDHLKVVTIGYTNVP